MSPVSYINQTEFKQSNQTWPNQIKPNSTSLFMTMDHVSDPKVINMRLCKGSREIFRISSICLTSCYLSLLATQHACAWDLISLIPNSAADSIRFSSNYSCQQQVLIIFTKLRHWLFPIISRFLHINGSHMKVAEGMREQISGALHNLIEPSGTL